MLLRLLYRRNQRKRIARFHATLDDYDQAQSSLTSGFDQIGLTFPLVVEGLSEKLGIPREHVAVPAVLGMSDRLAAIRLITLESDRINALPETDESRLPMLYSLDIISLAHHANFHLADQPHILPDASQEVADRANAFCAKLMSRGEMQIAQLFSTPPEGPLN